MLNGRHALILMSFILFALSEVNAIEWLSIKGRYLFNESGEKVILRGVAIPDPEHLNQKSWERPGINASYLIKKAITEFNVNVVRIPVLPLTDGKTGFFLNKKKYVKEHLLPAIELCKKAGIYVIIDLHYEADFLDLKSKVMEFWRFIASELKDYPNVLFEIFNEPVLPNNWSIWMKEIVAPVVKIIRSITKKHVIIVGGPLWSTEISGALSNPVDSVNVMYALHIYPNHWKIADCRKKYGDLIKTLPVFVTEWGYEVKSSNEKLAGTSEKFGSEFLKWMNENELHWTGWSFDNIWSPTMFNSDWSLRDGKEGMGYLIKNFLNSNKSRKAKPPQR